MKKIFTIILLLTVLLQGFGQSNKEKFDKEYERILDFVKKKPVSTKKSSTTNVINIANRLKDLIVEEERPTESDKNISAKTRALIITKSDPYILVLLERNINEDDNLTLHLRGKLSKEISKQINLLTKDQIPYYNYPTKEKQLLKFISIRSGNDLFTLAGLYDQLFLSGNRYVKDGGTFFQRNDDRDYTGSFLLEIGTDLLKTLRKRPLKTYQTFLYGFDVYTPYFKDSVKFSTDTSFNVLDRPHASFQYLGWSKKGLSRNNKYRWSTTLKFGKIGGNVGARFQNVLHQDISYSPRPRGWGAQVSNGGRIGISLELKEEFFPKHILEFPDHNNWKNIHSSFFAEQKLGTYMTTAGVGIQIGNKSFAQNNHNFINHKVQAKEYKNLDHFMYNIAFSATYVQHNTMLEGYGLLNTKESKNDQLTPQSRYYLKHDQVKRMNYLLNTTVSYTTRFATFFYNWKSISPETKLSNIGINSPASGKEMNIAHRWHHFAEIGFTFNVH